MKYHFALCGELVLEKTKDPS